jgi:hypothetical protein
MLQSAAVFGIIILRWKGPKVVRRTHRFQLQNKAVFDADYWIFKRKRRCKIYQSLKDNSLAFA